MKRKYHPLVSGSLVILLLFLVNGCTLIGYGVGAFADSRSAHKEISDWKNLDTLNIGEQVSVKLKAGQILEGEYAGVEVVTDDDYAKRYEEIRFQNSENIRLPAIGDTLTIYIKPARDKVHKNRIFAGLLVQSTDDGRESLLKSKYIQTGFDDQDNLKRICRIVDNHGNETEVDEVGKFVASGGLDHLTCLVINHKKGSDKVPLDDIELITVTPPKKMTKVLAAAGFVADAMIYLVFFYEPSENAGTTGGSG